MRFREEIDVLVSRITHSHWLLSYGNSPHDYPIHSCEGLHLCSRFFTHEALEALMGSLSSAPHIKAKILCFCVRLFDPVVELHALDEKISITFLLES